MTAPVHRPWCDRRGLPDHAACVARLDDIPIGLDLRLLVELHQAKGVPALVTLTAERTGVRQLVPMSIDHAARLATALERGVNLIKWDPFMPTRT